jgi:hypothetical protein
MADRSYLGIDHNDHNEWIVVLVAEGRIGFLQKFKNTQADLVALVRFIGEHCSRPKICVNPTSRAVLKLLKFIGGIPDVEVVLMSAAGLKMHRAWLVPASEPPSDRGGTGEAVMLARCAARMI